MIPRATRNIQAELDKAMAFARAGDFAAARAIWTLIVRRIEAAHWRTPATQQVYTSALHNLGVMFTEGRGGSRDVTKAAECYRKAATQGHAKAQYNLAILYQAGRGVPKDLQRARFWLDRAKANRLMEQNDTKQV